MESFSSSIRTPRGKSTPLIIALVGATAAGKTTMAAMLEDMGFAIRVPRQTTRKSRVGECPYHLQSVAYLLENSGDLIFGDATEKYRVPGETITRIRDAGFSPIVELGRAETARRLIALHPPGLIIRVMRALDKERFFEICQARGMEIDSICRRFSEAIFKLDNADVDYVIDNNGSLDGFRARILDLAEYLEITPRREDKDKLKTILVGADQCSCRDYPNPVA